MDKIKCYNMKYLKLNQEVTDPDYGHYITYSDELEQVSYEFRATRIGLVPLFSNLTKIFSVAGTDLNVALYGKSGVPAYNNETWNSLTGTLSESIRTELDKKFSWFPQVSEIELPNGDILDAPHFWASISMYFVGHGDLGSWAGDLIQYANDLHENPNLNFPDGAFGLLDWKSDLDAHNIYYRISGAKGFREVIREYWPEVTEESRCREWLIRGTGVSSRFQNSTDSTFLRMLRSTYPNITDNDITLAISKMQAYLDQYR
jgi:hypothetical protein